MALGFGVMALSVMCLLFKHENQVQISSSHVKTPVDEYVSLPIILSYGDRDGIPETNWLPGLAKLMSFRLSEICLKKE